MGQSGFELYFDINFEMRDGRGICTGEISVRFSSAVFIREWRRLFGKIGDRQNIDMYGVRTRDHRDLIRRSLPLGYNWMVILGLDVIEFISLVDEFWSLLMVIGGGVACLFG